MISIEGNISSGKSTVLKELTERDPTIIPIFEPIEEWTEWINPFSNQKDNVLAKVGQYDMGVQIFIGESMGKLHSKSRTNKRPYETLIFERTVETSVEVFGKNSLSAFEYGILLSKFGEHYTKNLGIDKYDLTIWLRLSPEKCLERTKLRNRDGESQVNLGYLCDIERAHIDWFNKRTDNWVEIDADRPVGEVVHSVMRSIYSTTNNLYKLYV